MVRINALDFIYGEERDILDDEKITDFGKIGKRSKCQTKMLIKVSCGGYRGKTINIIDAASKRRDIVQC